MRMTNLETSSVRNSANGHSLVENGWILVILVWSFLQKRKMECLLGNYIDIFFLSASFRFIDVAILPTTELGGEELPASSAIEY